jgi:KaiC/GvpD/RAD55 family RecA-like ATPase
MLEVARSAHDAGLCVLPPKQDGSKRPFRKWEDYANQSSTIEEVEQWYGSSSRTGIGVVLGLASENMECFEFDDVQAYAAFLDAADEAGLGDLVHKLESGYLESSPNGIHWLYRCSVVSGNTKLAQKLVDPTKPAHSPGNLKALIETRGQGGYAIIAPSHGDVHPSGKPYQLQRGGFASIIEITPEEREALWTLARSLDEIPTPAPAQVKETPAPAPTSQGVKAPAGEAESPGDWFNRTYTWPQVLEPHGWTHVDDQGTEALWRRPGKDRDHSATTNYNNLDIFKVFSSSTPFDPGNSYNKFAAYAILNHGGDFGAAARQIFSQMPKEARHLGSVSSPDRNSSLLLSDDAPSDGSAAAVQADGASGESAKVGETWMPVDLGAVMSGGIEPVLPTMLGRDDGVLLLYPGRIHEFKGHPEAGKGWFALLACRQELRAGNKVAYIDFEDYAEGILERLIAMGIPTEVIANQFMYFHPEESFGDEAQKILFDHLKEDKPTLCIIDSVAEVFSSNALNPNDNADAAKFVTMMPRPLANLGITVVLIDHITKGAENVRFSIGAQHKLAAVSGSSFVIEADQPLGVGMRGSSRIIMAKDRLGRVRKHAQDGKLIGELVIHSNDDGSHTAVDLNRPLGQTIEGMEIPKEVLVEVSRYVESQGRRAPMGKEVREHVTGRFETIQLALDSLVRGGYLFAEKKRNATCYSSIKPFEG